MNKTVEKWRHRLLDISWFMRVLNERIARMANAEDNCTGRFWEGRFKSQALLDEAALAACLAYVDLNPIRATMAKTPETSDHTSVQKRINKARQASIPNHSQQQAKGLFPFAGNPRESMPKGLPFRLTDYLELVDWSARIIREDKRGHMADTVPPILSRLNIESESWQRLTTTFEKDFKVFIGQSEIVKQTCQALGYQRTPGLSACEMHFP